ncbi:MarR family winged helix-turn-helix transcriptional regulator [Kitasatospora viridis]|uniref:DNA-binding MarR family transcriptional regulator n=1 Tax=Kitasatospora viridis TaxID=281105 RepID=A0A561UI51_9ACTN|nr:MarR family transcriptional regulator [Kitasatospora viridis]TWF99053.1 DNA-binding MarR family transcriptional regulator [Kitasatospora viridis]
MAKSVHQGQPEHQPEQESKHQQNQSTHQAHPTHPGPGGQSPHHRDAVDDIVDQWRRERPELDPTPMALVGRINRFQNHIAVSLREFFALHNLDFSEFDVLATLRRSGGPCELSAGALLKSAMVTSGAITNRVDRLSAKGLVERRPSPTDRRAVLIRLTPAGRSLVDGILQDHIANEEDLIGALSAEEREQLDGLLRKLLAARGDTTLFG